MEKWSFSVDPLYFVDRKLNYGRASIRHLASSISGVQRGADLGAGQGEDLDILRSLFPDADLHAIESFPYCQQLLLSKGFRVHPIDLERASLPFEDESMDLIVSNQILEHLKEVFWVLHEASRSLAVGGHLIIGVPNLASLHNRLALLLGRQPSSIHNNSAHLRGYTASDLQRLLVSGHPDGYELKATKGANFYPFPPWIATRLANMFPRMAWGTFMLFKKTKPYRQGFLEYPVTAWLETTFYLGPDTNKIWAELRPSGYGTSQEP